MAEITILTLEQLAEREQKPTGRMGRRRSEARTQIIEAYKALMQGAHPGYGADVFLADGELKRIVRQNLKAAAAEQNIGIEFRPIKDPARLHIRFITVDEQAAKPKGRGGRRRKSEHPLAELAEGNGETEEADEATEASGEGEGATEAQPGEAQEQSATPKRRRTRRAELQES